MSDTNTNTIPGPRTLLTVGDGRALHVFYDLRTNKIDIAGIQFAPDRIDFKRCAFIRRDDRIFGVKLADGYAFITDVAIDAAIFRQELNAWLRQAKEGIFLRDSDPSVLETGPSI